MMMIVTWKVMNHKWSRKEMTKEKKKNQKRKREKRSYVSAATKSTNTILERFKTYEKKREERELAKEERKSEEHREKMMLFEKLIEKLWCSMLF